MLPLGIGGIQSLHDWVLIQRAHQYLAETLPAAYLALDDSRLAEGQLALDQDLTCTLLTSHFLAEMPAMLKDQMKLAGVQVDWRMIPYDPNHWMGANQPNQIPVVTLRAIFTDHLNQDYVLRDSIEILID